MSDIAIGRRDSAADGIFRPRTALILLAVGIMGFVGMVVLGAYAPDFRSGQNGGAHALSNSATGFSGIVRLAEATGRGGMVVRSEAYWDTEDLVVITPERAATDLSKILTRRQGKPTLVVFPKWITTGDQARSGWVRYVRPVMPLEPQGVLAPGNQFTITRVRSGGRPLINANPTLTGVRFTAPRPLQTMAGDNLRPIVTDAAGRVVVGQIGDRALYVLADPDLLSNAGMKDPAQAQSALALLDWLNSTGAETITFDVTLNGFGTSLSPLRLPFDPPFLAMTLAIVAAMILAGWQALGSFGSPRRRPRAIAFGKAALVDNAAMLVRKAGRVRSLGGRYADVIRDRAAAAFGAPARLRDAALDAYLDKLAGRGRFTDLAATATKADDNPSLLAAAKALHNWKKEKAR